MRPGQSDEAPPDNPCMKTARVTSVHVTPVHATLVAQRAMGNLSGEFLASGIVFTALATRLGGGAWAVALLSSLTVIGSISQIFAAWYLQGPVPLRSYLIRVSGLSLFVLPLFGLGLWMGVTGHPSWLLAGLLATVFVTAVAGPLCWPAMLEIERSLISPEDRPRLFAVRGFLGALLSLLAASLTSYLLNRYSYPANYALVIFATSAAAGAAWMILLLLPEPARGQESAQHLSGREFLQTITRLLQPRSPVGAGFRHYLIIRQAIFVCRCAFPFLTLYAIKKFHLADARVGAFVLALMVGRLCIGMGMTFMPRLRQRPQLTMRLAVTCALLSLVLAVVAARWEILLATFFLQGVFLEMFMLADAIFIMEHAPAERAIVAMSLTMVALYPVGLMLPLIAAYLFNQWGFTFLVALAGSGGLVAIFADRRRHAN